MKIRYKIMLLFTLLVTAIISLLTGSVYYFAKLERKQVFAKRLKARATYNTQLYAIMGDSGLNILRRIDSVSLIGATVSRSIGMYTDNGTVLYQFDMPGTPRLTVTRDFLGEVQQKGEKAFIMDNREAIAVHRNAGKRDFIVVVAGHDDDGIERVETLNKILLISLILGVFLTALVSFLFARQLLRPIAQIIREVKDISSFDLSQRVRAGTGQDEMSQLGNTFNDLLGRLQEAFAIQRRFISNASHELSTPLTSVSSQVEVILQKDRSADEYKQVLYSVREDVQQMRQLTKSLLEIAKTGSQGGIELNEVRVDEVLMKVVGEVKKNNADYNVELDFGEFPEDEKDFVVFGNSELLYIAIRNVVENGCKYSPDKRSVVDLTFAYHKIFVKVVNQGVVIPAEEIPQIFQPFYRGATTATTRGFGLGLAMAERIIALHKGIIHVVSDKSNGTVFTIELPAIKIFN
ncbi:HAMP domain-containing sensor histidine kinase [Puia sp.]|uniref:HAMP domain-containing sensor histidine kinase n=1 Tax=Puia sp. TaxID=2045100 RepID=UPI002F4226D6